MQLLTTTLKEAIRGSYQVPLAKIEIINADGSSAGEILDVIDVSMGNFVSRNIKRSIKLSLDNSGGKYTPHPDLYDRNLLWYNKKMKLFYGYKTTAGNEWLPQGVFNINGIDPSVTPDGSALELEGQDILEALVEDQFDDIYKIEVEATESVNYALPANGASATASSSISVGDEIQNQAAVHYAEAYAVINGLRKGVVNESTTAPVNMIKSGLDWTFKYTPGQGETVTSIESEIFLDLKAQLLLQQIKINFIDGGALTDFLFTSPDNATWTSYSSATVTPSGPVRFIKFKVRKQTANPDGSYSLGISEIQVNTASNFLPGAAIDGDVYDTDWRPMPTDPDPWYRLDLGQSRTFNAIYTYWGNDSFDFWNRIKYFIETSTDGAAWSRIADLNLYDETNSFYGEVEHCITARTARYIRINIKGRDGVAIFRHLKVANITATKTIRDNMIDVLATTSITQYRIPYTRRYIERKMAEIGDEKEAFLQSLAVSANWQQGTDENGVYIAQYRNINPVDYAWDFTVDDDNIFEFNVFLSNDIKNVIVVTCEASDKKAIVGRASDTNPLSPTSVKNLGRRVQQYKGESYNTQAICDRKAQEQLFERTRSKHHTSIPTTGHPAVQVDDVVRVTVDDAKIIQAFFLVTGYETNYKADTAEFDTRINISLLV